MIKKLKIGFSLILALSLAFFAGAGMVYAAAGDLTWSAAQTIDLSSPDMNLTIASGSTASTFVVGTGTITPTLALGDVFTVATESAGDFSISHVTGVIITCSSSNIATAAITAAGSQAYTITPSTTACSYVTSGGGGGGGGGGTTTTTTTPTTPITPTTPTTPTTTTTTTPTTSPTTTPTTYNLGTTTLKVGSKGEAVKELQRFLGISADGIFGSITSAKVKTWQAEHGLTADGLVGPMTKMEMNGN